MSNQEREDEMSEQKAQMTNNQDKHHRASLPMPDRPHVGLVTYDAKDTNTTFPQIEPLERIRRAVRDSELREARERRPPLQPLPHNGAVRADAGGALDRS